MKNDSGVIYSHISCFFSGLSFVNGYFLIPAGFFLILSLFTYEKEGT